MTSPRSICEFMTAHTERERGLVTRQKNRHGATNQAVSKAFHSKRQYYIKIRFIKIRFDRMHRIHYVLFCTQPGKINEICFEIKKWVMQLKREEVKQKYLLDPLSSLCNF